MYKFKVKTITVKSLDEDIVIPVKKINIIIGPNNSGKSRFLKEVSNIMCGEKSNNKILLDMEFKSPVSAEDFIASYKIEEKLYPTPHNQLILRVYSNREQMELDMNSSLDSYYSRSLVSVQQNWKLDLRQIIQQKNFNIFMQTYGQMFYQYLGTEERLTICKMQKNYGFDSHQVNFLSSVKLNEDVLLELSKYTKELFNLDVYLDKETLGDRLVFRVGSDFQSIRDSRRSESLPVEQLIKSRRLDQQGDGLKSFVSTFMSMNNREKNLILIDEPEAFLHPPLARKIGELIGELSNSDKNETQIFVSTHSADILKGIISTTDNVNILRVTRPSDEINDVKVIDRNVVQSILNDPLLRVTRVIEGLFCERVIITESESDELVYQELIAKLKPEKGLYYAHGQNKQTIAKIAKMYKEVGVDYKMIVDFDLIRVPAEVADFTKNFDLDSKKKSEIEHQLKIIRDYVNDSIDLSSCQTDVEREGKQKEHRNKVYHKYGLSFFKSKNELHHQISEILDLFKNNELLVLRTGELETILEPFGVEYISNKKNWIEQALTKISVLTENEIKNNKELFDFLQSIYS